jgi:hypothetical protein
MNRKRLSTVTSQPSANNIQERVLNLLAAPSNYEIQPDGKILPRRARPYRGTGRDPFPLWAPGKVYI